MIKTLLSATAIAIIGTGAGLAGDGHSHPHTHPHGGHAVVVDQEIDPAIQHSHGDAGIGVTHTHPLVGGVPMRHSHAAQVKERTRLGSKLNKRFEAREQRLRTREMGAGFGPYSVAEWNARAAAGQPGLTRWQEPWPKPRRRHANASAQTSGKAAKIHPGVVSRAEATARATSTPTTYQISKYEWVTVERLPNGLIKENYVYRRP